MQSLYAAIDAARLDLVQKEEQVSIMTRQLQTAAYHLERERAAAAAAETRRMNLMEVVQQLDEETQVSTTFCPADASISRDAIVSCGFRF